MINHLLFFDIGTSELILCLLVLLLLFGSKKIPELARGLGKGIREFKDAANDINKEIKDNALNVNVKEEKPQQTTAAIKTENKAAEENKKSEEVKDAGQEESSANIDLKAPEGAKVHHS